MIPIRLEIKGLYSYRESVSIDFEKLAENQLFGIFGAVGSGKSAILEAITFALYGNSERLNSRDNRGYNMMNLQSQEMLIAFEFEARIGGKVERFLFRVQQKRNSKRFEDVGSPKRSALQWLEGEWQPLENTDATGILNLSYENFIKTIIIPQGKFQDFLHLSATDRTRMLREIFALDRYELSDGTKSIKSETEKDLIRLEEQLKPLANSNQEEIDKKKEELAENTENLNGLKIREQEAQQLVIHFRKLQELSDNIEKTKARAAALDLQKSDFEGREKKLEEYQLVKTEFGELLSQVERLERELKLVSDEFLIAEARLSEIKPKLIEAQTTQKDAKSAWEGRNKIELKIRDCERLIEYKRAIHEIATFEGRLEKGQTMLLSIEKDIQKAESTIAECDAAIERNRKLMPDSAKVAAAQLWFQQQSQLLNQITEVKSKLEEHQNSKLKYLKELQELGRKNGLELNDSSKLSEALQAGNTNLKQNLAEIRQKLAIAHQHSGLANFATELSLGSPCPLCGSLEHPLPFNSGERNSEIEAINIQINELEFQINESEKGLRSFQEIQIRLEEVEKHISKLDAELAKQNQALEAHSIAFIWKEYQQDNPAEVEADKQAIAQLQEIISKEEGIRKDLETALRTSTANQKKYKEALDQLKEAQNRFLGQRDMLLNQLEVFKVEDFNDHSENDIEAQKSDFQKELADILSRFETAQKIEKELEIQLTEWNQKHETASKAKSRLENEILGLNVDIQNRMNNNGFSNLEEVRKIRSQKIELEKEKAEIQHFKNQLLEVKTQLQLLESQSQSAIYEVEKHESAELRYQIIKAAIEELQKKLSVHSLELEKMQTELEKRGELEQKQAEKLKRFENIKLLEGLFKGSGFVKYVSTIYLQELVYRADVRFRKLSRNSLSLELGIDNDFLVRDMLNGGQTRSVKTLSGGQTFQASLCLALALADNVQQHSGSSHNFFFLDEGFGTLDKDSLVAVFDALKQLRQENRIVGVISHVEDLQQEIETHLKVWQTEAQGSLVKGSWE